MDGQACLDYMRVRKGGHGNLPEGDGNRVKRQKSMMVAIFKKMKEENMVLKVPELLAAFDGALFTNCTPEQTAALALFGYKLDPENIGAYSMAGDGATLFHWNFVFTRQSDRVKLIKQIYGKDVKTYPKYSLAYGRYEWCKMLQDKYMDICDPLKTYVQKLIDADDKNAAQSSSSEPSSDDTPKDTEPPESASSSSSSTSSDGSSSTDTSSSDQGADASSGDKYVRYLQVEAEGRKYSDAQRDLFSEYKAALKELKSLYSTADKEAKKAANHKSNSLGSVSSSLMEQMIKVQDLAVAVANTFNYTKVSNISKTCYPNQTYTNSPWSLDYWNYKKYNAIKVNFN